VYVTEQDAEAPVPDNVQSPENAPIPLLVKVTTSVGGIDGPLEVSVTVTVHVVA
jgi:hypothetical protein